MTSALAPSGVDLPRETLEDNHGMTTRPAGAPWLSVVIPVIVTAGPRTESPCGFGLSDVSVKVTGSPTWMNAQ